MSSYDVITSRSQRRHFNTSTIIHYESGSGGPVIDHPLFSPIPPLTWKVLYIFRKNNHRLPIATKQSFEIFIELKEIKQRNEVVEKHKCPLKQWKTVEKLARKLQKSSINRSVIQYILECVSDLFSMQ